MAGPHDILQPPVASPLLCRRCPGQHRPVARLSLRRCWGAGVDKPDTGGTTALIWAALSSHGAVVKALLGAGADVREVDADTETPRWIAGSAEVCA